MQGRTEEEDLIERDVAVSLVAGRDPRTEGMMPGWDVGLARQKTLFFIAPDRFNRHVRNVVHALDLEFPVGGFETRKRCIAYLLGITDSMNSVVELRHNLQSRDLHGTSILPDGEVTELKKFCMETLLIWEEAAPGETGTLLREFKAEDLAANKGDNLFAGWTREWESRTGKDPYGTVSDFLACFASLYDPATYYPALFLARETGKTRTQFFNDYGLQAARCRKIGSLGGTTNPVIAILGEDDFDGINNIWGLEATEFIKQFPNKWREVRRVIAKEQVDLGEPDDWGAIRFTEWVVVDAMLGLRSIFLLRGLGRVAFQLRPDWHADERKLTYAGGEIYSTLGTRVQRFDDILLEGVGELYRSLAAPRVGKPNNHFKIACTGQAALNVVRAFNAGYHPGFPDAIKERMFTNVTLSYDVPQMVASSLAIEEGIRDYECRTGEKVDDGEGGSVVTSMIGRFNDAIRVYRVKALIAALPSGNPLREKIKPGTIKSLEDPHVNNIEFISLMSEAGIDFNPAAEEDAIDHAATLLTKRAVLLLESKYGFKRTRLLTASKRKFHQNTDLLGVPFSTDFGNIQRMSLALWKSGDSNIECWTTIADGMNPDGSPAAGSVWEKRDRVLRKIWPDWAKAYEVDGVPPDEYIATIYVPPTLEQFLGFWRENIARAKKAREAYATEDAL